MGQNLTTTNKILMAAVSIADVRGTFTAEDLIVQVWQKFPESFGLAGYRTRFPDSNRILCKLMGGTGIRSRGWVERVTPETYRVTPAGRQFADVLAQAPPAAPRPKAPAARKPKPRVMTRFDEAETLEKLAKSTASQKFSRGTAVTFQDACQFWGVTPAHGRAAIEARFEEIDRLLRDAEQYIEKSGAPIVVRDGFEIMMMTVIGLQGLNQSLAQRFSSELHRATISAPESD